MADNKKQHYVPACYLQFFAIDGDIKGRESAVWVTEGSKDFAQSVASVAKKNYIYSKDVQKEYLHHKELEDDYPLNVRSLQAGDHSPKVQMQMMLFVLNLHFRNARYEVPAESERLQLYDMWQNHVFRYDICGDFQYEELQELADQLWSQWSVAVINSDEPLATSDNPALIFSDSENDVAYMLLPMTPTQLLVCYRSASYILQSTSLPDVEAGVINGFLAANSIGQLYSHEPWKEEDILKTAELREKYKTKPSMATTTLKPGFITFKEGLSFLVSPPKQN